MGDFLSSVIGISVGTLIYDRYISRKKPEDLVERALFVGIASTIILSIFK